VAGVLALPTAATTPAGWTLRRADAVWASNNPGQLSSKDFEGIMLLRTGLATAATVGCGGTPPSSWRLGALLSSDDFGSSVGRPGGGHPVYGDAWIDRGLA
jgi:hypothetical protein